MYTAQTVIADQIITLIILLSSLANTTPENSLTEDSINEMINQAVEVSSVEQIQTISAMQITEDSARTILQDLGLEMGGKNADGQPDEGEGGPGGEDRKSSAGNSDNPGNSGNSGNPDEGGEGDAGDPGGGETSSGDEEMDRGIGE